MKTYYSYAVCNECDNMIYYPKDTPLEEVPVICSRCGNDHLEYIANDDLVVEVNLDDIKIPVPFN